MDPVQTIAQAAAQLRVQKLVDRDMTPLLIDAAYEYAETYTGNFDWMRDIREKLERFGSLSIGQLRGVANCALAEARRQPRHEPAQAVAVAVGEPAGPGYYTINYPHDGTHVTLRLRPTEARFGRPEGTLTVAFLSGPDNTSSYTGCGFLGPDGDFRLWSRFRGESRLVDAVRTLVRDPRAAGTAYAQSSGNCWKCGRLLTDPTSIELGIGPVCRAG